MSVGLQSPVVEVELPNLVIGSLKVHATARIENIGLRLKSAGVGVVASEGGIVRVRPPDCVVSPSKVHVAVVADKNIRLRSETAWGRVVGRVERVHLPDCVI